MNNITKYIFTVLSVFVCLSSVYIIFLFLKYIVDRKHDKRKKNYRRGKNFGKKASKNISNIEKTFKKNSIKSHEEKEASKKIGREEVLKYDNGDIYKGEFIDGKRNGFGICIYSNREKYEGLWKNDLMNGVGKYIFKDGSVYMGDFKNGTMDGVGTYTYANKDMYKGYFLNGKRNGKGSLYYRDGSKYYGMWKNDSQSGNGKFISIDGDIYEGSFGENKFNGKGTYKHSNGSVYRGDFKNNVYHGYGCYTNENGDIYEGDFKYGLKKGNGKFKFRNGEVYYGEFKDDLFNGVGKYIYLDKSVYEGDFKNGKRHGIGTYDCGLYKYIGEWNEGDKDKIGTYYFTSGSFLEVCINNSIIKEGVYKCKDSEDMYLYNIDISKEKEIDVIENIYDYLLKEINNEITINTSNIYN